MKAIIIVAIVAIAVAAGCSFFAGYSMASKNGRIDEVETRLSCEHRDIMDKLNAVCDRTDITDSKIDRIENKLDVLVKIATAPQTYTLDR